MMPDVAPLLTRLSKSGLRHKYDYGHVAVLAGGVGRGGAARLAARGALRIGAGLVTVLCPPAALQENAARLDAIMVRPLKDAAALALVLHDARLSSLCLGPALGLGAREQALLDVALSAKRATVLDADALTLLAHNPALFAKLHAGCVLTPHDGEFVRLFPKISQKLRDAPVERRRQIAQQAARHAGCVVVLKGAATVIAAPDGGSWLHDGQGARACPWLATAGAGDVLAGCVAGLLARGFSGAEAGALGVWLHAEAARSFGPGLIAEDLPDMLPGVFRTLSV